MKNLSKANICILITVLFLCCRSDHKSEIDEARDEVLSFASQDFSCFSSLNVSIADTSYNIFNYLSTCCIMANGIHQERPLGYYCACASCSVIDEFSNLYYQRLSSIYGPFLDVSMNQSCDKYKTIYSVAAMCQGMSRQSVGSYILNNLHHFKDSLYITDAELSFCEQFVSEFNSDPYAINYCNYVTL